MNLKTLNSVALVVARSALAASATYYAYQCMPAFFAYWDTKQPLQWWAARATGFAAYGTLAASMVFGLMVSSRGLDGAIARKTVIDYHQQWTLAALILTVTHTLIIVTDKYVDISVLGALVPGKSADLTGEVAIGTLALWGMVVIIVSSWLRSMMSYEVWRVIHASATAVMLLGLAHGFMAGADSDETFARVLYVGTGAGVFGVTVFRLSYEFRKPRAAASPGAVATAASAPNVAARAAATRPARVEEQPALVLDLVAAKVERAPRDSEGPPRRHGRA